MYRCKECREGEDKEGDKKAKGDKTIRRKVYRRTRRLLQSRGNGGREKQRSQGWVYDSTETRVSVYELEILWALRWQTWEQRGGTLAVAEASLGGPSRFSGRHLLGSLVPGLRWKKRRWPEARLRFRGSNHRPPSGPQRASPRCNGPHDWLSQCRRSVFNRGCSAVGRTAGATRAPRHASFASSSASLSNMIAWNKSSRRR